MSAFWHEAELPRFAPIEQDLSVDVAVIGGGLTGLTTAWLLAREGRRVVLLERDRLAGGDTGSSTAHLTCVTDLRLHEAVAKLGATAARTYWEAGLAGIAQIARTVGELRADCGFRWTPGYLHAPTDGPSDVVNLRRDAQLAVSFGFDAQFLDSVPGVGRPGVRFGGQATFDPLRYAAALVEGIVADGGVIHESSVFDSMSSEPTRLRVNGRTVTCGFVVIATHEPLMDHPGLLGGSDIRDRIDVYTSYVVAARLPAGSVPPALYWDTSQPYDYLRVDPAVGGQCALFGGLDERAGALVDRGAKFSQLEERLRHRLPDAQVSHRWSGQLIQTEDGLPFIGENARREFIATGFCGNGFTLGTVAGMMACDAFLGRENPWTELFSLDRARPPGGLWRTMTRNLSRLTGRTARGPAPSPAARDRPASL